MILCKKKHLTVKFSRHGLKIADGTETFTVRFLHRNLRKKNLYLFDQNTAFVSKTTLQLLFGRCSGQFGGWKGINQYETTLKKIHLPETRGAASFIVVNPTPIDVFLLTGSTYQPTGSGVQVQDKVFYFGKDLIRYIARKEES